MKKVFVVSLVFFLACYSCQVSRYGILIKESIKNTQLENNKFFKTVAFNGVIKKKLMFSNKDEVAPRRIRIRLEEVTGEFSTGNFHNLPFYNFDSLAPRKLDLGISEEVFRKLKKGNRIVKLKDSDSVYVEKIAFKLW